MSINWKSSIPMLLWFVVLAILSWQNMLATRFYFALFISLGYFLLIPVLSEAGLSKATVPWVKKAGIFALFAAAFALVSLTVFGQNWTWLNWLYDFGLIVSAVWLLIGVLIGFFKWN